MSEEEKKAKQEAEAKVKDEEEATPPEETGAEKVINDSKEIVDGMKRENDRRDKLIEREEKLQAKKESLDALGGGSPAGTEPDKPKYSEEEKAARKRIHDVGVASGASWAKNYE